MIDLPTVAQINAISDVAALQGIRDDVERTVIQIETQLEHDVGDDDWAKRAANALALFRYTERVLERRIYKLRNRAAEHRPAVRRPEEDTHPLTLRALQGPPLDNADGLASLAEVETAAAELVSMINAVEADRADEIDRAAVTRDEGFITRTNGALRSLKALRVQLQTRRSELLKAARVAANAERNANRLQRFVDVAREMLPPPTYQAIWDRVLSESKP